MDIKKLTTWNEIQLNEGNGEEFLGPAKVDRCYVLAFCIRLGGSSINYNFELKVFARDRIKWNWIIFENVPHATKQAVLFYWLKQKKVTNTNASSVCTVVCMYTTYYFLPSKVVPRFLVHSLHFSMHYILSIDWCKKKIKQNCQHEFISIAYTIKSPGIRCVNSWVFVWKIQRWLWIVSRCNAMRDNIDIANR